MNFKKSHFKSDYSLSLHDTTVIKGLAICLLLWHHLFSRHTEYGSLVQYTAVLAKICVSLFLLVSAYGLTIKYEKLIFDSNKKKLFLNGTFEFVFKRLVKLYSNYWFVFILVVPVGIFLFHRNLVTAYGSGNILSSLLIDFFGLAGENSYNSTWWFYQLIIILYLLFPVLFFIVRRFNLYFLLLLFLLPLFDLFKIPVIGNWLFTFSLGISLAQNRNIITNRLRNFNSKILLMISILLLLVILFVREKYFPIIPNYIFLWLSIYLLVVNSKSNKIFTTVFAFLGKHSMNIFMIHSFIFVYFFRDFIYSFKYPFVIFFVLLIISLAISMFIEFLKDKLKFYDLFKKVDSLKTKY